MTPLTIDDIWNYHPENYVVIPTNGDVNRFGEAVMGRGLALQVKVRLPGFAKRLGDSLKKNGNLVGFWTDEKLVTFPVKHHWFEKASLELIRKSVDMLIEVAGDLDKQFYIPKVGCGNGQLEWKDVEPILSLLPDNFHLIDIR